MPFLGSDAEAVTLTVVIIFAHTASFLFIWSIAELGAMAVRSVWRAVVRIGLVALVGSLAPIGMRAQSADDLPTLRAQVSQLHSQGKYAEAAAIAKQYVALARQKHGDKHPQFATAIGWLAAIHEAQGRYADA